ncbi:hypothetical protein [Pontibacter sp. G13]|uniref:hypothetical protein n=1 Tax=Pontibacter sp. G13 TaxID=3074898 RepID=UPI00288BD576|nr:hypothetical protein [Pontibacter sp. G13]WNJ18409.1 hypothetical protein RJD25_26440 [Pontibacter sp. G13]
MPTSPTFDYSPWTDLEIAQALAHEDDYLPEALAALQQEATRRNLPASMLEAAYRDKEQTKEQAQRILEAQRQKREGYRNLVFGWMKNYPPLLSWLVLGWATVEMLSFFIGLFFSEWTLGKLLDLWKVNAEYVLYILGVWGANLVLVGGILIALLKGKRWGWWLGAILMGLSLGSTVSQIISQLMGWQIGLAGAPMQQTWLQHAEFWSGISTSFVIQGATLFLLCTKQVRDYFLIPRKRTLWILLVLFLATAVRLWFAHDLYTSYMMHVPPHVE